MKIRRLRGDSRPLYAQTVDALYALIREGAFPVGAPLPSAELLADQLGVSRSTLREAISYLEVDGLLVRRQGVGTYVATAPEDRVRGGLERLRSFRQLAGMAGKQVETYERHVEQVAAQPHEAEALGVDVGSELVRVRVAEGVEGCRVAYLDSLALLHLVDLAAVGAAEGSLLDYLVDHTAVPLAFTRSQIYAIDADERLAAHLGVEPGRSLLHLAEAMYTETGQPVALSLNYFVTDCFSFTIHRRIERVSRRIGSGATEA